MHMRLALAAVVCGLSLSSCAYDMYGNPYGYGSGYGYGYGYGGMGAGYGGYGYGGMGAGYGGYGYGPYGYGYGGYDPFGWYGNAYYPGVGIYVYDSSHHRHAWNDAQRHYWSNRTSSWQSRSGTRATRENWSGFNRNGGTTSSWRDHH